jgi:short-subunit dehydrogenase
LQGQIILKIPNFRIGKKQSGLAVKVKKFMNDLHKKYGPWVLIAGAAEGIGEGFSNILAGMGFNLIMVDQNASTLNTKALSLLQNFPIEIKQMHLDLTDLSAVDRCMKMADETDCRLVVYVAAYSRVKRFTDLNTNDLDTFIDLNCRALLHLVHQFSKRLISRKKTGGIVLISSLAGLIGPKYVATYAATKSFSIRLAEALSGEFREHGIDIIAGAIGTVMTPTYRQSNPSFEKMKPPMMESEAVAKQILTNLGRKTIYIPGFQNRLNYFFLLSLLPRWFAKKLVDSAMVKMYGSYRSSSGV